MQRGAGLWRTPTRGRVTDGDPLPPVVCFSNLDWGYLRYRKQHLMERIARSTDVVFVNPPRALKWRRPWTWGVTPNVRPRLQVFEPPVLPGMRRFAAIKEATYRIVAARLRAMLPRDARPIVWIYSPHAVRFLDLITPGLVVYDISDDYSVPTGLTVRGADEARELRVLDSLNGNC